MDALTFNQYNMDLLQIILFSSPKKQLKMIAHRVPLAPFTIQLTFGFFL